MNLSGECVRSYMEYYRVSPEDVIVIYDDIDLDTGKLRIRSKGRAGGHNGIKSLITHMGTNVFPRVRIGVGAKPDNWDLADHVLARFPKEEEERVREAIAIAGKAAICIATDGMERAMNLYSNK